MDRQARLFLDVGQSAHGRSWRHRLGLQQENSALAIAQSLGVPDLVARVLAGRGVGVDDAADFLNPTLRGMMPDPASFTDMEKAGQRIASAIFNGERVAVFGDYDVDGAASSALMSRFFHHFNISHEIYIPDRIFEGYGPNPVAVRELCERGAGLIITVDCGSNSGPALDEARKHGVDVVILDHHQLIGPVPQAAFALVNPNRDDDLSGQGHLCAAGVVFMALVRVSRILKESRKVGSVPDLLSLLDIVAIATICDVVPLTGVNRAFVAKGVQVARTQQTPGIAALAKVARIGEPLSPRHFGFMLGPRINAGGRIGDAALGSRLLATDDPDEALEIAEHLDALNSERQAMEAEMLAQAQAQADAEFADGQGPAVLVAESRDWHAGIVGLIASRLKDARRRPSFAIAFDGNGLGTGSGRSIPGFDLGRLVGEAVRQGLLVKGGGHAMAAGITVERKRLGDFRTWLEETSRELVNDLRASDSLKIDAAVSADGATLDLVDQLEHAGPFGAGNPQPVFVMPQHKLVDVQPVGAASAHLRVTLQSRTGRRLSAIAFRVSETDLGRFLNTHIGDTVHIAGTLDKNHWNGQTRVQFRVLDAAEIR